MVSIVTKASLAFGAVALAALAVVSPDINIEGHGRYILKDFETVRQDNQLVVATMDFYDDDTAITETMNAQGKPSMPYFGYVPRARTDGHEIRQQYKGDLVQVVMTKENIRQLKIGEAYNVNYTQPLINFSGVVSIPKKITGMMPVQQ